VTVSASEILSDKKVGLWREWPYKKSLKIPKGQSESVNRRTNNTMAKRKRTKEQTIQWPKEEEQTIQWPKEEEQTIQWPKEEEQTIDCKMLLNSSSQ
jgi:hypothetical protein